MQAFRSRRDAAARAYDILPPEPAGQTASHRPGSVQRTAPQSDVEDAQFVTISDSAPRATGKPFQNDNRRHPPRPRPATVNAEPAGLCRRLVERAEGMLMRMSADFFSALVSLVFVMVFGLAGGFSLIAGEAGETAKAASLDITHVTLTPQDANGMRVLLINGVVENRTGVSKSVPAIRADVLIDGQRVASTVIAPPTAEMQADHSLGFSARIPHPGGRNPQLRLSFAETGATSS